MLHSSGPTGWDGYLLGYDFKLAAKEQKKMRISDPVYCLLRDNKAPHDATRHPGLFLNKRSKVKAVPQWRHCGA